MKEEKTKSKKRIIYYLIMGICVLLLAAATVLTVYFVTNSRQTLDIPPDDTPAGTTPGDQGDAPQKDPVEPDTPSSGGNDDPQKDPVEPDTPSSGDEVTFVAPVTSTQYLAEYDDIYNNETVGWWYHHEGIDYAAEAGTEVRAVAQGVVENISYSEETGNLIVVRHADGLRSLYRFVEPDQSLLVGDTVSAGQKIGTVAEAYGSEAFSGPHLHLEMKMGEKNVDPAAYLEGTLSEK